MTDTPAPKVGILVPSGNTWEADTALSIAGIMHWSVLKGIPVGLFSNKQSTVSMSRNNLVERALKAGMDYVCFIDSDMFIPPHTVEQLLSHKKDIVGATYNKRAPPYETLGHLLGPARDTSAGGLHEADALPGGILMIKATVFEKLPYPWFFETYHWDGVTPVTSLINMLADWSFVAMPLEARTALLANPVIVKWMEDNAAFRATAFEPGRMVGEDYNFCRKAIKAGFKLYCDLDLTFQCAHIGIQHVTCLPPPRKQEAA